MKRKVPGAPAKEERPDMNKKGAPKGPFPRFISAPRERDDPASRGLPPQYFGRWRA